MLCHFLHDEGITNLEPHNLRLVVTHLLAQNCAVVKLKKQHEPCLAHFTIDNRFQFRERTWRLGRFRELGQIQPPTPALSAAITASNGFGVVTLNRSTSILLIGISSSLAKGIIIVESPGLHLSEPAIDKQLRSCDVACIVGCEKHHGTGDLVRLSETGRAVQQWKASSNV